MHLFYMLYAYVFIVLIVFISDSHSLSHSLALFPAHCFCVSASLSLVHRITLVNLILKTWTHFVAFSIAREILFALCMDMCGRLCVCAFFFFISFDSIYYEVEFSSLSFDTVSTNVSERYSCIHQQNFFSVCLFKFGKIWTDSRNWDEWKQKTKKKSREHQT